MVSIVPVLSKNEFKRSLFKIKITRLGNISTACHHLDSVPGTGLNRLLTNSAMACTSVLYFLLITMLNVLSEANGAPASPPIQRAREAILGMFEYYYRSVSLGVYT